MIQTQLYTAARPREICIMRVDIDTSGRIWLNSPSKHKNQHRCHERTIYVGPRAQEIIGPFMARGPIDAPLFSPRAAMAEKYAAADIHRHQPATPPRTARCVRDRYDTTTYGRAIARGCKAAGVPHWTPHQIRHLAATEIRREFGIEGSQLMLGHSKIDATQHYAELNRERALQIAEQVG